ncbi:MAG: excinuclease ABC subunit UvrA [Bacteroidales bacterium]|jgi:excinuclease ABC subunit A|nr:excinuclease ABC subunit UvrA [Bacteroidales bacterium]MDD3700683.1 excinuclease ABC subunit UvrA [Bacteroidales bacterium]
MTDNSFSEDKFLEIQGARVHNLRNIDLKIPRNELVVITGLSGSGKSSLAFDTIYAEGQRRYMESFSAYARQFIGNMERPDVDRITGLSPVISIEQKSVNRNPRSTVGTITEIYDFLRLLYARTAEAFSYETGEKMVRYAEDQIVQLILDQFNNKKVILLAPVVRGRKGHYRELFEQIRQAGFLKVRVDGEIRDIVFGMQIDRYKVHDIEMVIDRLDLSQSDINRLRQSVQSCMKHGRGLMQLLDVDSNQLRYYSKMLMCPTTGISYSEPEPNTFSFNSPYGACPKCNGLGKITQIDLQKIIPDPSLSIKKGGLAPLGEYKNNWIFGQVEAIVHKHKFSMDTPLRDISEEALDALLYGSNETVEVKKEYLGIVSTYNLNFEGIVNFIISQDNEDASPAIRRWAQGFMDQIICPTCEGTRLKKESIYFLLDGKNIADAASMDIATLAEWIAGLPDKLNDRQLTIGREVLREIDKRIHFLLEVGIDYLNLNRPALSLSGGESQRIRLATQIGSQLTGVLYILDEPSIGLHQRDNHRLINSLRQLRDIGNSVIVVEHDKDTILAADHVVDIGPGAGVNGGKIVAQGKPGELMDCKSITCQYLSGKRAIIVPSVRRNGKKHQELVVKGARGNNLKNVELHIPLGKMICVTGVSGSGKSSLINETLYPILSQYFYQSVKKPLPYDSVEGLKLVDKVIEIDQAPIGRTPRSNPATYTKVFDEIRKLFAGLPESKIRAYKPGRFSFNVSGGRCEACKGAGMKIIEMNFLPDVAVQCEVCHGKRYNRETLEVRYKGKSINDVLNMTIDQAIEFFENIPAIYQKIRTLRNVGLGYLTLGQSSTTISGGEAQRVKLASELSKRDTGKTIYILDEPTTGLHFEDVKVLLDVLNKLVDKGNTVIIIEHNMEVIKTADHIIDLGPEGGIRGGEIIAQGTPEQIAKHPTSYTAYYLKPELQ